MTSHRILTRLAARRLVALCAAGALSLTACDTAKEYARGVDIQSPPPEFDASMVSSRAAVASDSSVALEATRSATRPLNDAGARITPSVMPLPSNTIRLSSTAADTSNVMLLRPIERAQFLKDADRLFASRAGCNEAVRLYASLAKPADITGALGTEWATAQLRIAQCSMELREWTRTLEALANVKAARPREWSAPYFEGQTYCQMGQYERGTKTFRDLNGLMGTLATGARQAVSLLSKYGTASCDRLDYESAAQPERNKDQLDLFLGEYEEFIRGAESLQARTGFPTEYAKELSNALKSARENSVKYSKS